MIISCIENEKAFEELDKVAYPNKNKLLELLRKYRVDWNPKLTTGKYTLKLDLRESKHLHFFREIKELQLMSFYKLSISWISNLNLLDFIDMNAFFKNSSPKFLQNLYLHGEGATMISLVEGLPNLLKAVRDQVYLFHWNISSQALRVLLENIPHVKDLVIRDCEMSTIDLVIDGK